MRKAILLAGFLALSVLAGCQTDEKNSKNTEDVKKIEEATEEKGKETAKRDKKESDSMIASLTEKPEISVTPKPSVSVKPEKKSSPTPTPTSLPAPTVSPEEGTISRPADTELFPER